MIESGSMIPEEANQMYHIVSMIWFNNWKKYTDYKNCDQDVNHQQNDN